MYLHIARRDGDLSPTKQQANDGQEVVTKMSYSEIGRRHCQKSRDVDGWDQRKIMVDASSGWNRAVDKDDEWLESESAFNFVLPEGLQVHNNPLRSTDSGI